MGERQHVRDSRARAGGSRLARGIRTPAAGSKAESGCVGVLVQGSALQCGLALGYGTHALRTPASSRKAESCSFALSLCRTCLGEA